MFDRVLDDPAQGMYLVPCELFQLLPDELYSALAMMPTETGNPMDSYAFCGLKVTGVHGYQLGGGGGGVQVPCQLKTMYKYLRPIFCDGG